MDTAKKVARGFRKVMKSEGGSVTTVEAAKLMDTSPEAVRKAAKAGRIIAVTGTTGELLVPIWQFDEQGRVLPGIRKVVATLRARHPYYNDLVPVLFFLNASPYVGGRLPIEAIRSGDIEQVLAQARTVGE